MGVTYKLKDEVVHYIISQRQSNPLSSCRQLAESASEKFGVHLSKSSVHDVLKESGIITPRGRKPKDKFEIPHEKKKQIQVSLSQVKLLTPPIVKTPIESPPILSPVKNSPAQDSGVDVHQEPMVIQEEKLPALDGGEHAVLFEEKTEVEHTSEYEGAGRIFYKAALWDLGIFSEEGIKEADWKYYLTYTKGIKVFLENDKSFFIDLPLPLERCIREAADGLINNIRQLVVDKVSDQELFYQTMDAQVGYKIRNVSIVDRNDHNLFESNSIVEHKRDFVVKNRLFVDNSEIIPTKRSMALFFSQNIDNNEFINNILNLNGYDTISKSAFVVNLLVENGSVHRAMLQEAAERLNEMCLYDEQDRLVRINIQS